MFLCYSLKSFHPHLLPQSPKVCSLYLCLFCCLAYILDWCFSFWLTSLCIIGFISSISLELIQMHPFKTPDLKLLGDWHPNSRDGNTLARFKYLNHKRFQSVVHQMLGSARHNFRLSKWSHDKRGEYSWGTFNAKQTPSHLVIAGSLCACQTDSDPWQDFMTVSIPHKFPFPSHSELEHSVSWMFNLHFKAEPGIPYRLKW